VKSLEKAIWKGVTVRRTTPHFYPQERSRIRRSRFNAEGTYRITLAISGKVTAGDSEGAGRESGFQSSLRILRIFRTTASRLMG
jgi:hypothetical protein